MYTDTELVRPSTDPVELGVWQDRRRSTDLEVTDTTQQAKRGLIPASPPLDEDASPGISFLSKPRGHQGGH